MRLVIFCESGADFQTVVGLVDGVLRDEGPSWVATVIDSHPETIREWIGDGTGNTFFDLHRLTSYTKQIRDFRVPQGHFDGKPGASGALMARTAFHIVRAILRKHAFPVSLDGVDAVFIVWDMDDQGDLRREGLLQARAEAVRWASFDIVLGCPDMEREAWVIAGFEPENDVERLRLEEQRRTLGFSPCDEAHRLRDKDERALRSPKRVLHNLTEGDYKRAERCWVNAPLDRLRMRGTGSGLQVFLNEVKEHVVILCKGTRASSA